MRDVDWHFFSYFEYERMNFLYFISVRTGKLDVVPKKVTEEAPDMRRSR